MVGVIAVLGSKVMFTSNYDSVSDNGVISLSTNPNPLGLGQATFLIDVKDKNGKPVNNAAVSFDLNMTTMNMGIQQGNATFQGNGQYSIIGRISMGGPWRVRTKVKMPNGNTENKDFFLNVP